MRQLIMFHSRLLDKFMWLLLGFALLLVLLFFYLKQIDSEIQSYDQYHNKLEEMVTMERRIEQILTGIYRHINYDRLVHVNKRFKENIAFLRQGKAKKNLGMDEHRHVDTIEKLYRKKIRIVERFKTYNARTTHAIHYLFDLRKTINRKYKEDLSVQELVDSIFFAFNQIVMNIPIDQKELSNHLRILSKHPRHNIELSHFYKHSKEFMKSNLLLRKSLKDSQRIKFAESIVNASEHIKNNYKDNLYRHQLVTLTFFMLAFLLLFVLLLNYLRMRRVTRELRAFRYAIEHSDNAIVITDHNRHIQYVNDAFEDHCGYTREEALGQNPNMLKSGLQSEAYYREMNAILSRGEKWEGEFVNRHKNGSLVYEKASIVPIVVDGELTQYIAVKLDVTPYVEQQQRLEQSAAVYDNIGDGIMITNSHKEILSVNPAFITMFGYDTEELLGNTPSIIDHYSEKQNKLFFQNMQRILSSKDRWTGKIENKTKSGKILPVWLTVTVVRSKNGDIANYIAIYTNLEEIVEMEEKAEFLAYHDSLTHLPNRAHFEREITHMLELATLNNERVATLFIDLDRFKTINDTLGHHIGDLMLVDLAGRIKKTMRSIDLLARIGGDEFVVILNPLHSKKTATTIAKKILAVIREPMVIQDHHLNITASIGIAIYPDDGVDKNTIIKHADSAMYHAKDRGKDRYEFYSKELSKKAERRLGLEQELNKALDNGEIYLHFQPQYDLINRKIIGAEALVRWHSPTLGHVSPDLFIDIAEETGVIVDIGYFVFEGACSEFMRWREAGLGIDTISINISAVQFREKNLLKNFGIITRKYGIAYSNIEIEITESYIMEYSTTNLTILDELRNLGCRISIDDFGTGYSSMSYMKSLPLDTVKIDKSFVNDLPHNSHDAEVSRAIIALSKSLGYRVIAEGIETIEQEKFLADNSCDTGQGYYFGKPMSTDEFMAFAKKNSTI